MSDEEESGLSEDETEILVYVEFEGYVDSNTFKNDKLKLDIVGIDSDHPIMQINGKFYEGTYHDAVGTYMFFDHDDSPVVDDPVFDTPATLKYFAKTRKLLKMERVFAMQRTEVLGDLDHNYCIPNIDTIKEAGVPPKYQEDALKFWMNMRDDRMQALTTYLEKQQIREEKRSQGIELDSESDDDNPFAMYKPTQDKETEDKGIVEDSEDIGSSKSREMVEPEDGDIANILDRIKNLDPNSEVGVQRSKDPVKKFTVIDPGPSTSRQSDLDMPSLTIKKRRKGTPRVTSKLRSKDVFKKPNKRAPKSKKSVQNSMMNHDFEEGAGTGSPEAQTELSFLREIEDVNLSDFLGTTSAGDNDNSQSVGRSSEKSVCPITKRLEKQAKRDAKMKEISERLKTLKETQLRIHNPSSSAKDSETIDT